MILIPFVLQPGVAQVRAEVKISFTGNIDHIPKDQKFIIVNEMGVYLLPNTKIVSARGTVLNKADLKRGFMVRVEGVRKPEGIVAERITLVPKPRVKP